MIPLGYCNPGGGFHSLACYKCAGIDCLASACLARCPLMSKQMAVRAGVAAVKTAVLRNW